MSELDAITKLLCCCLVGLLSWAAKSWWKGSELHKHKHKHGARKRRGDAGIRFRRWVASLLLVGGEIKYKRTATRRKRDWGKNEPDMGRVPGRATQAAETLKSTFNVEGDFQCRFVAVPPWPRQEAVGTDYSVGSWTTLSPGSSRTGLGR